MIEGVIQDTVDIFGVNFNVTMDGLHPVLLTPA
jgi:hypothetical protein